ncbi:hypothetical protein D3C84_945650 [compost metagenome]
MNQARPHPRVVTGLRWQGFQTGDFVIAHLRQQTDFPGQVLPRRVLVAGVAIMGEEQEIDALIIGRCARAFLHGITRRTPGRESAVQQSQLCTLGFGQFLRSECSQLRIIGQQHQRSVLTG